MKYPNFNEERKLWRKGYKCVAGLDEAGRGPLAGPVVAAAVVFKIPNFQPSTRAKLGAGLVPHRNRVSGAGFPKIKDSKKLSPKKREEFFKILTKNSDIEWGIGRVSEKVIDKINILEATKLAMKKAVNNLEKKISSIDFLILDGNFGIDLDIPQKSIIKADEKVFSCAAASIVAKVYRDKIMMRYHKKYPHYRFDKHKGYPTKLHRELLKKHGPCEIHRKSFRPVAKISKVCYPKRYNL